MDVGMLNDDLKVKSHGRKNTVRPQITRGDAYGGYFNDFTKYS